MKKMIILAAFGFAAALTTPAMAQTRDKNEKQGEVARAAAAGEHKKHKGDPKKRTAKLAEKLNFTDAQKAQLSSLNAKYPGTDFDRKAYRQEFKAILTDAQKQQLAELRAKHKEKKGQRGEKKKA
jgi:Spy/CpxP family protein refolding chaperone